MKVRLQQFLLPGTACPATKRKLPGIPKSNKTQLEETEQASEPDTVRMLELSDQEFKTTMTNMLRALMVRAVGTHERRKRADGQCKWTDGNPKKEPKRNVRDENPP